MPPMNKKARMPPTMYFARCVVGAGSGFNMSSIPFCSRRIRGTRLFAQLEAPMDACKNHWNEE